jgi:hypothetical protein
VKTIQKELFLSGLASIPEPNYLPDRTGLLCEAILGRMTSQCEAKEKTRYLIE